MNERAWNWVGEETELIWEGLRQGKKAMIRTQCVKYFFQLKKKKVRGVNLFEKIFSICPTCGH